MPSIRRSLIIYFLGLLGLGFGLVAAMTARVTDRTLEARDRAAIESIDLRAEELIKQEQDQFDRTLLAQARTCSRLMHTQAVARADAEQRRFLMAVTFPSFGIGASGPVPLTVWTAGCFPARRSPFGPLTWPLVRDFYSTSSSSGNENSPLPADDEDHTYEYVQVNASHGRSWRSPALPTPLKFDPKPLEDGPIVDWRFDDVTLAGDTETRRVILKTPSPFMWWSRGFRGDGRPSEGRSGNPPPPPPPSADPGPRIYIQLLRPTADLTASVQAIRQAADREKWEVASRTHRQQTELRFWLVVIGGVGFVGTLVGGSILIGRGLNPVRQLSDAVSRVSERDFRLPIDSSELSWELLPIHARLTHTLDALRRAFVREKQAVADISHELRTPVASLLATLDVALRKSRSAEEYRTTLEDCRGIGKQLGILVERVMTLARLDADADQVNPEKADAADIATGCTTIIRPLAESQGLTLSTDIAPAEVVTDPHKLREVLMNLLHNAVEYNRPGGSVKVTVRRPSSGGAEIEVRDSGIGMTPEIRERIFERFFRADPSRHAAGVHAGLGLAIVKGYLDRLGGTVSVDSTPGEGSTFRVTLPPAPVGL